MSEQAVIDPLRFARTGESLAGTVDLVGLPRLQDRLAKAEGAARYRLTGQGPENRKPSLHLQVEVELHLVCQRCLEPYPFRLEMDATLLLARTEAELAAWEEADPWCEGLVAEPQLDVLALVEDEILLGLPMVPRHPAGECPERA
ncbi:MAG: YceD family protein [Pseudomonadota bacterium]